VELVELEVELADDPPAFPEQPTRRHPKPVMCCGMCQVIYYSAQEAPRKKISGKPSRMS